MDPPPPPPPPHGSNSSSSQNGNGKGGLPPGNYDIFIIPPHSSGSGFLYLPSLQPHRNSFVAGVICTLLAVAAWVTVFPLLKQWFSTIVASGGAGVLMLLVGVGIAGWAWGKTQLGPSDPAGGSAGGASHTNPKPKAYSQSHADGSSHSFPNGTPGGGASNAYGNANGHARGHSAGSHGEEQHEHPGYSHYHNHNAPPRPPTPEPAPQNSPPPKPNTWQKAPPDPNAGKSSWERMREETKKKEEERKRAEDLRKKADELRKKAEEVRKRKEEEEKEKQRLREKEQRERELREAREKREKERKDAREKEERDKAAAAAAAEEAKKKIEREAAVKKAREEAAERASKRASERIASQSVPSQAAPSQAAPSQAAPSQTSRPASPIKRPAASTTSKPTSTPGAAAAAAAAGAAHSVAGESETAYSFRPYDKPRRPYAGTAASSSTYSASSYAPSESTARTTPPPSNRGNRGPYTTKDPDKIVIKAVYSFPNAFTKAPLTQLVSGMGPVTDGLILRVTTEGLFIDDDVRGVPQREWDVKAWTLKLVEVWCPCLQAAFVKDSASSSFGATAASRAAFLGINSGGGRLSSAKTAPLSSEETEKCVDALLSVCKRDCLNGGYNASVASGEHAGMHVLRATIRDQEGKRYLFVLGEEEGWKVAVGLQRLRRGSQVRALGVSGMPANEVKAFLDNMGWL